MDTWNALTAPLQTALNGVFGDVMLAVGLILLLCQCFFGYRLRKLWVTLIGFFIGGLFGTFIVGCFASGEHALAIALLGGGLVGALGALIAYKLYRVGLFFMAATTVFGALMPLFSQNGSPWVSYLGFAVSIALAIAAGVLTLRFLRPVVIVTTAVGAGLSAAQQALLLFSVSSLPIVLAAGLVLAVIGMTVQFATTRGR